MWRNTGCGLTPAAVQISIQLSRSSVARLAGTCSGVVRRRPASVRRKSAGLRYVGTRIALSFGYGDAGVETVRVIAHGENQRQQLLFSFLRGVEAVNLDATG